MPYHFSYPVIFLDLPLLSSHLSIFFSKSPLVSGLGGRDFTLLCQFVYGSDINFKILCQLSKINTIPKYKSQIFLQFFIAEVGRKLKAVKIFCGPVVVIFWL